LKKVVVFVVLSLFMLFVGMASYSLLEVGLGEGSWARAEAEQEQQVQEDEIVVEEAPEPVVEEPQEVWVHEPPPVMMPQDDLREAAQLRAVKKGKAAPMPSMYVAPLPVATAPEAPVCAPVCPCEPPPEFPCPVVEDDCVSAGFWPKLFSLRHVWGDQENTCVPFATNYTTAELLLASNYRLGHVMPLLDLRGHRFDNNTYAWNVGVGGRYIPNPCCDSFCEMLGFNAYYDSREGGLGYYRQVGLGLEVLGSRCDFRANAYVPFGNKRHILTCVFDDYDGDFIAIRDSIESVSYSFNAEIGFLVFDSCHGLSLYLAGGPYFMARGKCDEGVPGGEVRIKPQYKDYVAVDASWRYDHMFKNIWQVAVIFDLPLYQITAPRRYPCGLRDWQIYQPIDRFEVMPLSMRTCWQTNF
jgi:hypothetical protein